jgi:hypothetical protein
MSGETERNVSGWTVDTLREHLTTLTTQLRAAFEAADFAADVRNEQRFTAQQQAIKDALTSQKEAVAAALVAAEKAVLVAETNAEKWRGAANEWRGAMNDRERTLMPRSEAEQRYSSITNRQEQSDKTNTEAIKMLTAVVEKSAGRREGLMIVFAVVAALATVVTIFTALRG